MKIILSLFAVLSVFTFMAAPAMAQWDTSSCPHPGPDWLFSIGVECGNLIPSGCIDSNYGKPEGCGLEEAFQTIVNFTQLLLAMTGSVLILMFVYGGTMMIISGTGIAGTGDQKKTVNKGKDAIKAGVIGLVIILGAWLAINFTISALTGGEIGKTAELFGNEFNKAPSGGEAQQSQTLTPEEEEALNALPNL